MKIGVDLGGTKIEAVRVDSKYQVLARHRLPTEVHRGRAAILANLMSCIRAVWHPSVQSIGLSVPGYLVDGVIKFGPNTAPLVGANIVQSVGDAFGVHVVADNDANCFALAEFTLGVGTPAKVLVGIIIGTGVGAGFVFDGVPFSGASGSASELGYLYGPDGLPWEHWLSGPAIVREYMAHGGTAPRPHPSAIWVSDEPAAVRTRQEYVARMGLFLASVINVLNPDMVVLGGGVSNIPFYPDIIAATRPHCVPGAFEACIITKHSLGDSAGSLGAALLVKKK